MKKRKYTIKIHIYRLKLILKKKKLRLHCPAAPKLSSSGDQEKLWSNNPCIVCTDFLNIKNRRMCPCYKYRKDVDVREATFKAIERYERKEGKNEKRN